MPEVPTRLDELRAELREFVSERDWQQFHDPKNLAMCLASEVGELLAEYRWISTDDAAKFAEKSAVRTRIAHELGDIGIAWLLLCDRIGLDPLEVVKQKLDLNRLAYPIATSRGRSERP